MYDHILISSDGSALAQLGVDHGLALAKLHGSKVTAVTVTEPLGGQFAFASDLWTPSEAEIAAYDAAQRTIAERILGPIQREAEEMGLTSKNFDQQASSTNPAIQRIVGSSGDVGKMLGVDNKWAYNIIKQVGNYGESFDTNLKPLGFERGLNRQWTQGGLMYAPPIR